MCASMPACATCHYRLPASHTCFLGAVDKPSLCPRGRPVIRIALTFPPACATGYHSGEVWAASRVRPDPRSSDPISP